MILNVITIFPELFNSFKNTGIIRRAFNLGDELNVFNPRDFVTEVNQKVDDAVFGGGPGTVLMIEPLEATLNHIKQTTNFESASNKKVIYLSPQGEKVTQQVINNLINFDNLVFVCGRYEGIDERFIHKNVDLELSIGDFVVSGGELPAMLVMDAILRLRPNVLGNAESFAQDSFMNNNLLDCPHYTRPREYMGMQVPDVLLSGNHKQIQTWRHQQQLHRTLTRRPDLLENVKLNNYLSGLLKEVKLMKQEQDEEK